MSDIEEFMTRITPKAPLKVAELFAGVGGFRLGLESTKGFKVVWSNQWEPGTTKQHASDTYSKRFNTGKHSNEDISKVPTKDIEDHDLLVGGFPCQDYSVARTLSHASGILGKKGVLWWQIHRILKEKAAKKPPYLMLENVDRLLKSPAKQRGRDFALMLSSLAEQGYIVEWRVINAADYGMPQRRRRVFIMGYKKGTPVHTRILKMDSPFTWLLNSGTIATEFPVTYESKYLFPDRHTFEINGELADISEKFCGKGNISPFDNTGVMIGNKIYTLHTKAVHHGARTVLGDILINERHVPPDFFINPKDLPRWKYLKGAKKEPRKSKTGHVYNYSEGPMAFPDPLDKPARTIVTGEGGSTPSRFKHVIRAKDGRYRRLTPLELERINMFPDEHTKGVTDARRAFFMGNALVVGVVRKLGRALLAQIGQPARPAKKQLSSV
jgi:DNA (cytosine-5)-methyltransferase 1